MLQALWFENQTLLFVYWRLGDMKSRLLNTVGIWIPDYYGIWMVDFNWNRASDYRTIWISDKLVRTTIGGGQNGNHLKTWPSFKWLKQDDSQKCFNYLKTSLVFRWLILWNQASEYRTIWMPDFNLFGIQIPTVDRTIWKRAHSNVWIPDSWESRDT